MVPRISVLITAYQAERDIGACLALLQKQSFADWEAVVVDDGSTDGTRDVVRRLIQCDGRIRLLSLGRNCGPDAARNAGLRLCCGEWVALLDADDQFLPARLERLLAYLRFCQELRRHWPGALAQALRCPSLLGACVEALWRRRWRSGAVEAS